MHVLCFLGAQVQRDLKSPQLPCAVERIGMIVHLKGASKNARALAKEMQTTQTTRMPYTISHLGSFCSATGLRDSQKNIYCLTAAMPH